MIQGLYKSADALSGSDRVPISVHDVAFPAFGERTFTALRPVPIGSIACGASPWAWNS